MQLIKHPNPWLATALLAALCISMLIIVKHYNAIN